MNKNNNDINGNDEEIGMYYPDGDSEHMAQDDKDTEKVAHDKRKGRNRKKGSVLTKKHITVIAIIAILYTALLLIFAWVAFYNPSYHHPDDDVPFNTDPIDDKPPIHGDDPDNTVNNDYTAIDNVYNILVVGHDSLAHLADVIMIVNVDTNDHSIAVMQIPRDTLISTDIRTGKINELYPVLVSQKYGEDPKNYKQLALSSFAEILEQNLCINIHHTVLIDLNGFKNIVNAIGGVDVYVQHDMFYEDPDQNLYITIPAGYQHLDGAMAEGFVRFRSGYVQADLGRVNAQKIFLTAAFNKVKTIVKSFDVASLSALISQCYNNIVTDLTTSDIMYYAKEFLDIDLNHINMTTLPGNVASIYYVMNREGTLEIVNRYFNVYKTDISDSIFDRNKVFCLMDVTDICNVYFGDAEDIIDKVYNGGEIDQDSINIPGIQ